MFPSEAGQNDLWPRYLSTNRLKVAWDNQNIHREEDPIFLSCPCSNHPRRLLWLRRQTNSKTRHYTHSLRPSLNVSPQACRGLSLPLTSNMIHLWPEVRVGILTHSSWRQQRERSQLNVHMQTMRWYNYVIYSFGPGQTLQRQYIIILKFKTHSRHTVLQWVGRCVDSYYLKIQFLDWLFKLLNTWRPPRSVF